MSRLFYCFDNSYIGVWEMKKTGQMSLVLCLLLILQLVLPTVSVFAATLNAPNDVRILVNNGNNVQLKWTEVSSAQSYNVYQIKDNESKLIGTSKYAYYNMHNQPEGNYVFEVRSYSAANGESASSESIELLLTHPEMEAPEDLSVTVRNGNDLFIKWSEVEFATGYNIYRIKDDVKELVLTTDRLNRTFANMPEGDYVYEVHSLSDRFGESEAASHASHSLVHPQMAAPSELNLSIRNGNDIYLKWAETEFATSYNIYQINNGVKKLVNNTDRTNRTFTNMPAGNYTYEVHAVSDRFGESVAASQASYSLVHPNMVAPMGLDLSIRNGNDILLKWAETEFATSYNIYQIKDDVKKLVLNTDRTARTFTNMPAGAYIYEVHAVSDRFDESEEASKVEYSLLHPKMTEPQELNVIVQNGNDLFLKWTEVEFASSYNVYQLKDGLRKLIVNTTNLSRTFTNMPAGDYEYEVTSLSDRFGESQTASQVTMTLVHPEMEAPLDLTLSARNGNDLFLKWTEVKLAASYNIYHLKNDKKTLIANTTNLSRTFTNMPEDWYEYEVTAVSSRFGESAPSNSEYTLGNPTVKSPELQLVSTDEQTATLKWTEIAGASIYNIYEVINGEFVLVDSTDKRTYTITDIKDGPHQYVVTVTHSRFGESVHSNVVAVEVQNDLTAPVTASNVSDAWMNQDFGVILTAEDDKSGVNKTFYSLDGIDYQEGNNFTLSAGGIKEISFYSTDLAGNVEEVKTAQVKIDKASPETSANATSNWHQEFTVQLKAEDAQSGVDKTFYSVNDSEFTEGDSVVVNKEGVNSVTFYSTDLAGNVEEVKTAQVKIDQIAPETVSDADGEWYKEFTVELTATDDKAGVEKTFYSVNGSEFKEGSSFTVSEDGINTISFYSVDKAGNIEELRVAEVKIDQTAPETVSNIDEEWHQELTVELIAADDKSPVAHTFYSINGSEFAKGTTLLVDQEGINEILFYSVNKAGSTEDVKTATVKIDRTAPETAASESAGWQQGAVIELTGMDEKSGVDKIFYSVNGSEYTEGTSIAVTEKGINTISFYSVDKAGNLEEAKTVEVKIDLGVPDTISNVSEEWLKEDLMVELTAKDDLSGIAATYYSVGNSEFLKSTNFQVSKEGVNEVNFYSTDIAGNKEEIKTKQVKIDKTVPLVSWSLANEYALGTELALTYSAIDAVSGIASEALTVNGKSYTNGETVVFDQPGEYKFQLTVTDNAGWVSTLEKIIVVYIPANTFEVKPGVIKGNSGIFSVEVTLPKGFDTKDFVLESATINGVSAITGKNGFEKQAEKGHFRFNREDFSWIDGVQVLEFHGMAGDYLVVGQATVETKASAKK